MKSLLLLLLLSRFSRVLSVRPHRRQPTKLPCPWDSPGKITGVGCHFLLQCMKVKSESEVAQSCATLATPWTAAYQAPPSMGFSRQEYWSALPFPSPSEVTSCVQLLATPWTAAYEAPPSMGFSRQEYRSGLPLPSPESLKRIHQNTAQYVESFTQLSSFLRNL